jgi:hypothetical protein
VIHYISRIIFGLGLRYWISTLPLHFLLRTKNFLFHLIGIWNNCQSSGRNLLLCLFIRMVIKRTVVIIKNYHRYQLHTKSYSTFFCLG